MQDRWALKDIIQREIHPQAKRGGGGISLIHDTIFFPNKQESDFQVLLVCPVAGALVGAACHRRGLPEPQPDRRLIQALLVRPDISNIGSRPRSIVPLVWGRRPACSTVDVMGPAAQDAYPSHMFGRICCKSRGFSLASMLLGPAPRFPTSKTNLLP
uniref:Uncharacterized protein n=1 Tax=Spongospora subterranea TaxID=70186 RepID=A0A0H5R0X3_9EUKA|eukprot:CRZ07862.1 hypothetical protein [Spongospora subterranea]